MSNVSTADTPPVVNKGDVEGTDHPGEKTYIKIALILAVLTAAEVATYPSEDALGVLVVPILLVLMVIKFWYVAAFFMHLKYDTKMFSAVYVAGVVTAVVVFIGTLAMFHLFA